MPKLADRVKETTTTTGTGAISMEGAVTGFQAFSAAFATGDTVYYCIENGPDWEVGIGTLTSGTPWTMARTSIMASSNAGAAVNWAAGTKNVFVTVPAAAPGLLSREALTAARTYYVATTGNDSNNGLSAGAPFLTIQKAVDTVAGLDINTQAVTIQVADGTYAGAVVLKAYLGAGPVTITGNATTPTNVVIAVTSADAFNNVNAGTWNITNLKVSAATSGHGLYADGGNSKIRFSGIDFGACVTNHMAAYSGASIVATGNYTVSGGSSLGAHAYAIGGGTYSLENRTITISNTPAFATGFVWCDRGLGYFSMFSMTFSGTGATGPRYVLTGNGVCFVNGAATTYLPGDVAGTTANGGQYF